MKEQLTLPARVKDLRGQKFGTLLVEKYAGSVRRPYGRGTRTQWYCQCLCGCGKTRLAFGELLQSGHTNSCRIRAKYLKDLTGMRFGHLVAIQRLPRTKGQNTRYICRCDCGKEVTVINSSLRQGGTVSCGCMRATLLRRAFWKGHGGLSLTAWNKVCFGAKRRGIPVNITIEDAWSLFEQQQGQCALTGWPIEMDIYKATASLDRIDNTQGYVPGNCQWVHKDVNLMKHTHTQARFIELCRAVAAYTS